MLTQARRDAMINDLGYPMTKLCNWKHPVGDEYIFPDDIMKRINEARAQGIASRRLMHNRHGRYAGYGHSSGYGYDSHYNRFGGRRGFRGDKGRPLHKSSYPKMKAQGKRRHKYSSRRHDDDSDEQTEVCLDNVNETLKEISNVIKVSQNNQSGRKKVTLLQMENTPDNFIGGKLADKLCEWEKVTSDRWILDTVKGYSIEFSELPSQSNQPHQTGCKVMNNPNWMLKLKHS